MRGRQQQPSGGEMGCRSPDRGKAGLEFSTPASPDPHAMPWSSGTFRRSCVAWSRIPNGAGNDLSYAIVGGAPPLTMLQVRIAGSGSEGDAEAPSILLDRMHEIGGGRTDPIASDCRVESGDAQMLTVTPAKM